MTLVVEGYVAPRNIHNTCTSSNEIGLHAQNMITITGSVVNIINQGDLYDHYTITRTFHLDNEYINHVSSKNHEKSGYGLDLGFAIY